MKKLRLRILAIPALALMAAFGAIGPASAAAHGPAAVRGSTAASIPAVTPDVAPVGASPRIGCGGANANIEWTENIIQSWGEAWDTCGSGTYVQIFLDVNNGFSNDLIATAGPDSTVGFNTGWMTYPLLVGNIIITACEQDNGWHCGTGVKV
jgi:hypothetical protein